MDEVAIAGTFNYGLLSAVIAEDITATTERIKERVKRSNEDIYYVGHDLLMVKGQLDHGMFGQWLEAEFGWSDRTAQMYMSVAQAFDQETIAQLSVSQSVMYKLAAPSTPPTARDEIINQSKNGRVSVKEAEAIIRDHKLSPSERVIELAKYHYGEFHLEAIQGMAQDQLNDDRYRFMPFLGHLNSLSPQEYTPSQLISICNSIGLHRNMDTPPTPPKGGTQTPPSGGAGGPSQAPTLPGLDEESTSQPVTMTSPIPQTSLNSPPSPPKGGTQTPPSGGSGGLSKPEKPLEIWQQENHIRLWLNSDEIAQNQYGFNAQDIMQSIKDETVEGLEYKKAFEDWLAGKLDQKEGINLHYKKSDYTQALNNVLEQLKQEGERAAYLAFQQRQRQESEALEEKMKGKIHGFYDDFVRGNRDIPKALSIILNNLSEALDTDVLPYYNNYADPGDLANTLTELASNAFYFNEPYAVLEHYIPILHDLYQIDAQAEVEYQIDLINACFDEMHQRKTRPGDYIWQRIEKAKARIHLLMTTENISGLSQINQALKDMEAQLAEFMTKAGGMAV